MKQMILILLFCSFSVFTLTSKAEDEALKFSVDVLNVNVDQARQASIKALLIKKWQLNKIEDSQITAKYRSDHLKVDLSGFPEIALWFEEPDDEDRGTILGYVKALRKNILAALVDCADTGTTPASNIDTAQKAE